MSAARPTAVGGFVFRRPGRRLVTAITLFAIALLAAAETACAAGPDAAVAATAPSGSARPIYLWAAGRSVVAYPLPRDLLETLARDVVRDSSRALLLHPDLNVSPPETLALPAPVISAALPKIATQILLPEGKDSRTLVLTRAGIVPLDLRQPQKKGGLFLPGWDFAQGARAADGTIYLLERAFDEDLKGGLPAPLLSWKGGSELPDTIAVCSKGSQGFVLAPGDSVIWVSRLTGRAVDRLVRRDGRWERREMDLVPPLSSGEERWGIGVAFADPPNRSLFFSQKRGMRPDLLEVLPDGLSRTIYTWGRGLRCVNGVLATDRRMLLMNGVTSLSLLDLATFREWSVSVPLPVTIIASTPDADWVAMAVLTPDRTATMVHLLRRGSARTAMARVEGLVSALAIQVGDRPRDGSR